MSDDSRRGSMAARQAFATLIEGDRAMILDDYARGLDAIDSSVGRDSVAREQSVAHVGQILTDIVDSVRMGRVHVDENYRLLAWDIGETRAASAVPTRESWWASALFFEIVVGSIVRHVTVESAELFEIVLRTLNQSIMMRMREATDAYTGYLLRRIDEAHIAERRRIARELHDRVGSGLSAAYRRLELFHLYEREQPIEAAGQVEMARQTVVESIESLRAVTSDLRLMEPLKSLEKALVRYIESIPPGDAPVHLRVNGDETWAPPAICDESFLIIREAIRNALAHGDPTMVLVGVDIAPHELRAVVEDTGCGFDLAEAARSNGAGLASMQERAALMGGMVTMVSKRGQGTQVELVVPLPERREAVAGRHSASN